MQITNRLNLPDALVRAVQNDPYDKGIADYSCTGLIKPPRIGQLLREHGSEITEDASDRIWSLFGQIAHSILERAAQADLVEHRLYAQIGGKTISGQLDLYRSTGVLTDWKVTKIYKAKDGVPDDWVQQMNINRWLCEKNQLVVSGLEIVALYRDYSVMMAHRRADYPVSGQVEVFKIPRWPMDMTEQFILERIALHEAAKTELPECTAEERWQKPPQFALMKKGQKRAVKLYDSEEEATAAAGEAPHLRVEDRPSEPVRCRFYCPCLSVCKQGQDLVKE